MFYGSVLNYGLSSGACVFRAAVLTYSFVDIDMVYTHSPSLIYLLVNQQRQENIYWMGGRLRAGKPSRYVTSHLGQLSLLSLRGRWIEYRPDWLGWRWGAFTCVG